jgi:hypothetical protein
MLYYEFIVKRKVLNKSTRIVAISNCGFPEQSHFQVLRLLFRRMARNLHWELIAEIYRGGGGLLKSQEPTFRPMIENYKHLLRKAGKEVVKQLKLSEETREQLEQPLLPIQNYADEFIKRVNHLCDERLTNRNE